MLNPTVFIFKNAIQYTVCFLFFVCLHLFYSSTQVHFAVHIFNFVSAAVIPFFFLLSLFIDKVRDLCPYSSMFLEF